MSASPAATSIAGPERPGGQGLDPNQEESGNLAILHLLTSEDGELWTDFVATVRSDGAGTSVYEAWARRGLVRWVRHVEPAGGYRYEVIETAGENPLANQDHTLASTLADEIAAGGNPADIQTAYVPPASISYPYAYERISQLFDSPNAPDLIVNSLSYAYGRQPGQHGNLDVIQSRSPLIFSGPGVRRGHLTEQASRQIDIAPTIARLMGFPLIDGADITGRTSSGRGVPADVYLRRQDGYVLEDVLDASSPEAPQRIYIILLDGQAHTELFHRLEADADAIPNLRRLINAGTAFRYGSITNFPSITWPSHNAIGTGTWSGHHDIVNPTYYLRETKQLVSPQGQQFDTAKFLGAGVETLYEAFHRVYGEWDGGTGGAFVASINEPCTRGADHASLERRLVGDREQLKALTQETDHEISPRWANELQATGHHLIGLVDNRALAQARQLITDESHPIPKFFYHEFSLTDGAAHDYGPHHEGAREALDESDRQIGHVLAALESRGAFESTLFVITTDHGMAIQDVSLRANAARIPERSGMAAITAEPLVYLRDLDVRVEVAHDGRTAQISVLDNDADESGTNQPVEGARIVVTDDRDRPAAAATTDAGGNAGIAIPADLLPAELACTISAEGFNTRHLRLNNTNTVVDLRKELYGA